MSTHTYSCEEHTVAESLCNLSHQPSLSMKDNQLKSVIYLKEVSDRLIDLSVELQEIKRIFSPSTDVNVRMKKMPYPPCLKQ